jgi:hypothetical protein
MPRDEAPPPVLQGASFAGSAGVGFGRSLVEGARDGAPAVPGVGRLVQGITVNGRIMSLSSCSTMWQW